MAAEESAQSKESGPTTAGSDLPRRKDGFRERGGAVTRAEAFVDAAFAFAVTLLVIRESSEIPNVAALTQSLLQIPAFATSFALVCLIWFSHHTWSRRYGLDDTGSVVRSLFLVFLLLIWIFPLHLMFKSGFAWLSQMIFPAGSTWRIPFTFRLERGEAAADMRDLFVIYGFAWSSISLLIAGLYKRAWKQRDLLDLDLNERVVTRGEIAIWHFAALVGGLSIGVAVLVNPTGIEWLYGAPGMVYFLMCFSAVVSHLAEKRARAQFGAPTA